jgi:hypothetical protein
MPGGSKRVTIRRRSFLRRVGFALAGCALSFSASFGASIIIAPLKDNTLYESASGTLSNGQGDFLFAGQTSISDGINLRRGLIAFNLSADIPTNAVITDVTLTLYANKIASGAFNTTVTLSRLTGDWGEGSSRAFSPEGAGGIAQPGDATWLHQIFSNNPWTTPGGDFVSQPSASRTITSAGVEYSWSSAGLVSDVQFWINNPSSNFGWIIRGNEASSQTSIQFDSRSNFDVAHRPELTVEYEIVPEPSAAALLVAGGGICGARFSRRRTTQIGGTR